QSSCQQESEFPRLVVGMRGERAGTHQLLTKLENEGLTLEQAFKPFPGEMRKLPAAWSGFLGDFFACSMILRSHVALLQMETNAVESAKLPNELRHHALMATQIEFLSEVAGRKSNHVATALFPDIRRHSEWDGWLQAYLSCAVTAMATERFRLQEGRWP